MKIAVAVWKGQISPVFDTTAHILVAEIEGRIPNNEEIISLEGLSGYQRTEILEKLGVNLFICDGITRPLLDNIRSKSITVIHNICGPVDKIIEAFCQEKDIQALFSMPGKINKESV